MRPGRAPAGYGLLRRCNRVGSERICERRRESILLQRLKAGLLLCGLAQAARAAEEPRDGLLRIPASAPAAVAPLDWILRRVPSAKDAWVGEQIHEDVAARLHELADLLRGDPGRRPEGLAALLRPFLTADFRGGRLGGLETPAPA